MPHSEIKDGTVDVTMIRRLERSIPIVGQEKLRIHVAIVSVPSDRMDEMSPKTLPSGSRR
jgi:hypothetical protein